RILLFAFRQCEMSSQGDEEWRLPASVTGSNESDPRLGRNGSFQSAHGRGQRPLEPARVPQGVVCTRGSFYLRLHGTELQRPAPQSHRPLGRFFSKQREATRW